MFDVSDTTVYSYKRKDKSSVLHYDTFLLLNTDGDFSLSAYLKDWSCAIELEKHGEFRCDSTSIGEATRFYRRNLMVHSFRAIFLIPKEIPIYESLADLKFMFHLSFTGHSTETPEFFSKPAIVLSRLNRYSD